MWGPLGFYEKALNSALDFYGRQTVRVEEMTVYPGSHKLVFDFSFYFLLLRSLSFFFFSSSAQCFWEMIFITHDFLRKGENQVRNKISEP